MTELEQLRAEKNELLQTLVELVTVMNSDELVPYIPIGLYPVERRAKEQIARLTLGAIEEPIRESEIAFREI